MNSEEFQKIKVQRLILGASLLIFLIKLTAWFLTSSVSILSDAMESTVNVFTGIMTYFSLKYSLKPKDTDHPYGHGKIELITASVEGILIGLAGLYIIYEAGLRFFNPTLIHDLDTGVVLVAICGLMNYGVAQYSIKIGKKQKSIALVAGGQHLLTDTWTSLGLIGGLLLVWVTRLNWIDSAIAIIFGMIILRGAYKILKHTVMGLMDKVDMIMLSRLVKRLGEHKKTQWIYGHKLAVLHFGHIIHVDMHLTLPYYFTLQQSLEEVQDLKRVMKEELDFDQADISVQTEPCQPNLCEYCKMDCPVRSTSFHQEIPWDVQNLTGGNRFKV